MIKRERERERERLSTRARVNHVQLRDVSWTVSWVCDDDDDGLGVANAL